MLASLLLVAMAGLLIIYYVRYSNHSVHVWSAPAAWLRAMLYFIFCLLVAIFTGALEATLASPLIYLLDKDEKLSDIGHN